MKSNKGKAKSNIQGKPIHLTADLSAETLQTRRKRKNIYKVLKGKNVQPRLLYPARISFRVDREIKKLFRQAKIKRIQYQQTSFTTNVKGTYMVKKYKRRKRSTKQQTKPQTINKVAIGTYISIITLNVNGLNSPTKRHRLAEWIQK